MIGYACVSGRERSGGPGDSLESPGLLLTHLHTGYTEHSGRLPALLNHLVAEKALHLRFVWLFCGENGLNSGIISLLGCRQLDHHHIGQCHTESMAATVDVAIHLAKFAFFLVAGPAAFHSLRCVHRPQAAGGELALLRASCGHSTDLAKRRLERWGWTIRALGAVSTLGLLVGAAVASAVKRRLWVALMCLGVAAAVAATTGWWLSMMVGAALVQTPVDRVRAQVQ
jgi:hypothetical protein